MYFFDPGAWMNYSATNFQTLQNTKNMQILSAKVSDLFKTNKDLLIECQAISAAVTDIEQYVKFGKDLPCPYCAQLISKHALVCNYCQGSLSIGNAEYIRVVITAKPYLAARDAETIKQLMAEVARIDSEQQELQRIIAEIEEEKRQQEELKEIEFKKYLQNAEGFKRIEREKLAKEATRQLDADFDSLKKLVGLAPDKFRKAENLMGKGDIEEFVNYVVKELELFNKRMSSLEILFANSAAMRRIQSDDGTYYEISKDIQQGWTWFVLVGKLMDGFHNKENLEAVSGRIEVILGRVFDGSSRDQMTMEMRAKFGILLAYVYLNLGNKRQAKKYFKQIDTELVTYFQKKFYNQSKFAKNKGSNFYNDFLGVFNL